ncbi:hypothetical protein HYALB_00001721 [Hymenoscyphus albidus]|uniref:Uncharacterized protein n=1 Tax=Hymenoscyphus albidus TaxID=595503 RepID=A0A9N9LBS0_9HELO|nr:hypothetical protein HYALB_00001721 [Hymenoscyphus albidus]
MHSAGLANKLDSLSTLGQTSQSAIDRTLLKPRMAKKIEQYFKKRLKVTSVTRVRVTVSQGLSETKGR